MKIYLGKTTRTDTEGCFEAPNGALYEFEIEVMPDMVRINDSVGRCMPVDADDIGDMAEMLGRIDRFNKDSDFLSERLKWELMNVSVNE